MIDMLRTKRAEMRNLFCEVERLISLILVIPASSATVECLFSCVLSKKVENLPLKHSDTAAFGPFVHLTCSSRQTR